MAVDRRLVTPARPGLKVCDPDHGGFLSEDGAEVEWSTFWQRRLEDGDVVATPVGHGVASKPAKGSKPSA